MITIASELSRKSGFCYQFLCQLAADIVLDYRQHYPSYCFLFEGETLYSRELAHSIQRVLARFYGRNEPCPASPPHAVRFCALSLRF